MDPAVQAAIINMMVELMKFDSFAIDDLLAHITQRHGRKMGNTLNGDRHPIAIVLGMTYNERKALLAEWIITKPGVMLTYLGEDVQDWRYMILLRAGKKIPAIKLYRAEKDIGLREAKDVIDGWMDKYSF